MTPDVVALTEELVAIESISQISNVAITDRLIPILQDAGFEVERLEYADPFGTVKVNLVGKKGAGKGGFCLFSHSDTVPGDGETWEPFSPKIEEGLLIGRGSCDMKGPVAATIVAGASVDGAQMKKPLYIAITADEEWGHAGAKQMVAASQMLNASWPEHGVVAEPTELRPVYAHKGGGRITVTAHGKAAHTSMDRGVSANFLIAPFLAEMAELAQVFRTDTRFRNTEFEPPTNGFNMVLDDGNCATNVTAGKTVCTLSLRFMPNDHREEAIRMITDRAEHYGFDVETTSIDPFYIDKNAEIIRAAVEATGADKAVTVPFGTEAETYSKYLQAVILGPGNIAQAHTVGEWIDIAQLRESVAVYTRMIEHFCT